MGETLPRGAAVYNSLKMYFPDGNFECVADRECYRDAIRRFAGDDAVAEWDALEAAMAPSGTPRWPSPSRACARTRASR